VTPTALLLMYALALTLVLILLAIRHHRLSGKHQLSLAALTTLAISHRRLEERHQQLTATHGNLVDKIGRPEIKALRIHLERGSALADEHGFTVSLDGLTATLATTSGIVVVNDLGNGRFKINLPDTVDATSFAQLLNRGAGPYNLVVLMSSPDQDETTVTLVAGQQIVIDGHGADREFGRDMDVYDVAALVSMLVNRN
jgi:hypothetical protein